MVPSTMPYYLQVVTVTQLPGPAVAVVPPGCGLSADRSLQRGSHLSATLSSKHTGVGNAWWYIGFWYRIQWWL